MMELERSLSTGTTPTVRRKDKSRKAMDGVHDGGDGDGNNNVDDGSLELDDDEEDGV